jgi:hypothetical protein
MEDSEDAERLERRKNVPRKISCVAHGKNAPWVVGQKPGYLEHTDSDF